MITTITLNPSLDRINYIKNGIKTEPKDSPGGKGINVYKVLDSLGATVQSISLIGGKTGKDIKKLLSEFSSRKIFIPIGDDNRVYNLTVDMDKHIERILRNDLPRITSDEMNKAMYVIKKEVDKSEIVIISGSLPEFEDADFCPYEEIMNYCRGKEKFVVIDTSGDSLKRCIELQPDLIKPNINEFSELLGYVPKSFEDILEKSMIILEKGVKRILLSLGKDGVIYIDRENTIVGTIDKIDLENTIGAGDTLLAGFVYSFINKYNLEKSLMYSMAMAASNCENPGIGVVEADYGKFFDKISIKTLLNK